MKSQYAFLNIFYKYLVTLFNITPEKYNESKKNGYIYFPFHFAFKDNYSTNDSLLLFFYFGEMHYFEQLFVCVRIPRGNWSMSITIYARGSISLLGISGILSAHSISPCGTPIIDVLM